MLKLILQGGLAVICLALAALIAGLVYRAYRQNQNARDLVIAGAEGINEEMFVPAGGIGQWVRIRGRDRRNPVILLVHGGPGFSYAPFTASFRSWEDDFTVAMWDQRGAGRTFGRSGKAASGEMTIEQITRDGIEVAEFVARHLGKKKVIMVAHSWGTIPGLAMAARRPDLFHAYVGTGQIADMPRNERMSYDLLLDQVRSSGNEKAVRQLEEIGPPPYGDIKTWMVKGRLAVMNTPPSASGRELPNVFTAALFAPGYSLRDAYNLFDAFGFSSEALYGEMMAYDARRLGTKFDLPVVVVQGENDIQSPAVPAKEFFDLIEAPRKEFVPLPGEGHTALLLLPDVFLNELKERVRPVAIAAEAGP